MLNLGKNNRFTTAIIVLPIAFIIIMMFPTNEEESEEIFIDSFLDEQFSEIIIDVNQKQAKLTESEMLNFQEVIKSIYSKEARGAGYSDIVLRAELTGKERTYKVTIYKDFPDYYFYIRIATASNVFGVTYLARDEDHVLNSLYQKYK